MIFNPSAWIRIPAERYPGRPAVKDKDLVLSYGELNSRANRLAWSLLGLGLKKGDRVATLQYNCHQSFELFVALWKAGLVMVPLNTRDTVQQNLAIISDAGVTGLVFGSEFMHQAEEIGARLPSVSTMVCHGDGAGRFLDYEALLAEAADVEPDLDLDEDDIYRIHYTSGTTGTPRGVVMTYRNRREQVANVFMNADRLIDKNEVFLHVAPLTHAAGYYSTPYYLKGALHVIHDRFDPARLLADIQAEKVTCTLLVPTMIVMLLEREDILDYDLSSLKRIFYGTAPMPTAKLKKAISIFGDIFRQNYGLTEAVQPLACLTPDQHQVTGNQAIDRRLTSTGFRAIGPELRIVNDDDRDVNPGEIGEIVLRGPHLSPGYLNLPEMTRETYRGGWLHTGDLGRQDEEGFIYIVDRKKDMIISGGFNIYSREVEMYLDSHPAVLESAVVGQPDDKWGEVCTAFIVLRPEKPAPSEQELIDHCQARGLSKYKAPKVIILMDNLPKNENKKIIKTALREMMVTT